MRILKTIAAACVIAAATATPGLAQSLIRDTEIEHMLRDYTTPLFIAAGLEPNDVGLYIIADPSINAFVTGGQNIFTHTGTIIEAENPNQLRGVLAHETGHISGAHLARVDEGLAAAQVPMFVSVGLGVLAALAGEGQAAGALLASSQQFGALQFMTYSRAQESAADQAGLNFLEASGNSGEGLVAFFERFRYQEVMSQARRFPYFRSHPLSSQRIVALRENVNSAEHFGVLDPPVEVDRLRRIQAKIYGFTAAPQFVHFRYPETDQSLYARYARAVAYYREARIDEAQSEIQSLVDEEPLNPYFHELFGQMLFESGRAAESIPYHQTSVDLEPTAPLLRVNLAIAMIATENPEYLEEAAGHLRVALNIEHDNSFAWYQLSIVHERNGNTPLAQLAVAEQAFAVGNRMRANQFAGRARAGLENGTTAWFRATELEAVSQPTAADLRQMRRQRRNQ
jgi:predicted Zn-dependent protease